MISIAPFPVMRAQTPGPSSPPIRGPAPYASTPPSPLHSNKITTLDRRSSSKTLGANTSVSNSNRYVISSTGRINNNSNYSHNYNLRPEKSNASSYENKFPSDIKSKSGSRENRDLGTLDYRRCEKNPSDEPTSLRSPSACYRGRSVVPDRSGGHDRNYDYNSDSNNSRGSTRPSNPTTSGKSKARPKQPNKTNYADLRVVNNIHCRLSHCARNECSKNSFAAPCPLHPYPTPPPPWPFPCPAHGTNPHDPSRPHHQSAHINPLPQFDAATSAFYAANPHVLPNPLAFDPRYHFATMPARGSRSKSNSSSRSRSTCRSNSRNPLVHCITASKTPGDEDSDEEYGETPGKQRFFRLVLLTFIVIVCECSWSTR